jgi:hypothetical protein
LVFLVFVAFIKSLMELTQLGTCFGQNERLKHDCHNCSRPCYIEVK